MQFLGFLLLSLVALAEVPEIPIEQSTELSRIFQEQNARGTFVLLDAKTGKLIGHEPARAEKRFIPASTFKIPNTLIGLEAGAVKSVDEVLPYGGKPQPFPTWEHDMPLREAIRLSAVPIYQELARRIGFAKMKESVARLDYGNKSIGTVIDRFWLDGPLEISAVEQTQFLARLMRGQLHCRPENIAAVKEITQLEKLGEYQVHGKTGWCTSSDPDIGWWVGWLEKDGKFVASFALNIDVRDEKADIAKRVPTGRSCLQALGYK